MTFSVRENKLMLVEADWIWGPRCGAPPWWHEQGALQKFVCWVGTPYVPPVHAGESALLFSGDTWDPVVGHYNKRKSKMISFILIPYKQDIFQYVVKNAYRYRCAQYIFYSKIYNNKLLLKLQIIRQNGVSKVRVLFKTIFVEGAFSFLKCNTSSDPLFLVPSGESRDC